MLFKMSIDQPSWMKHLTWIRLLMFVAVMGVVVVFGIYFTSQPVSMHTYTSSEVAIVDHKRFRIRFPKTSRRLPQCIIIGARKSGTRALLEMLNLHPQIQKASAEVHFFDRQENFYKGIDWYRKKMPFSFENQITMEKSPSYFVTPEVPERIFAMNDSIKLLLILREPVTRLLSDYTQLYAMKQSKGLTMPPFEEMVLTPEGSVNTQYKAVRISMYYRYIQRWYDVFPRESIHIVDGEKLITNPLLEIKKVEDFLGIEHRVTEDNFVYSDSKGFYCLRNETTEKCLASSKGRKHPQVDEEILSRLRQFYLPFNKQLYRMTGINFNWPEK